MSSKGKTQTSEGRAERSKDECKPPVGVLSCRGLEKRFGGVVSLANVSLSLQEASIVAIVGPNGAGKTTLLNVWTGVLRADAGEVFLGEVNVTGWPAHKIAKKGVARTFQDLRLISMLSVLENVMLGRPPLRSETFWGALHLPRVKIEEAVNATEACKWMRFVGLQADDHALAGEISYGEQKMLALACALATEANVLLLDEPAAGLHPAVRERLVCLLKRLKALGKVVVLIEHDLAVVRAVADRLVFMDEGRVIAEGTPADVLGRPEVVQAFVG